MKLDPIASDPLEALTTVSRKIRTVFDQQVTAHGLTYPRARLLLRLSRKQNVTQRELARDLDLEQATLARLLDRMEENGLISRRPDDTDRRAKLVVLTPRGEEQARLVIALGDRMRERIFGGFDPEELRVVLAFLERTATNLTDLDTSDVPA